MGIGVADLEKILTTVKTFETNLQELSLVELGEQEWKISNNELEHKLVIDFLKSNPRKWPRHSKPLPNRIGVFAADYFNTIFSRVVSIDLKTHCAHTKRLDLGLDLDQHGLSDTFDLLTNFGTTEHIGQDTDNSPNPQYIAFRNIHNLVKTNGLMFHVVPFSKTIWKVQNHGAFSFDNIFFEQLAKKCQYKVIYNEQNLRGGRGGLMHVQCCLVKQSENRFISEKEFNEIKGIFVTKGCMAQVKRRFLRDRSILRKYIVRA